MKVPGGWKDFFKNVGIATALMYGVGYLTDTDPSIGSSVFWAIMLCGAIAFVESRLKGDSEESAPNTSENTEADDADTGAEVESSAQEKVNGS